MARGNVSWRAGTPSETSFGMSRVIRGCMQCHWHRSAAGWCFPLLWCERQRSGGTPEDLLFTPALGDCSKILACGFGPQLALQCDKAPWKRMSELCIAVQQTTSLSARGLAQLTGIGAAADAVSPKITWFGNVKPTAKGASPKRFVPTCQSVASFCVAGP